MKDYSHTALEQLVKDLAGGRKLEMAEASELVSSCSPADLYQAADQLRRMVHRDTVDLCSIVNAKSGKCTEDCKFCAQSSRYQVEIDTYEVVELEKALVLAKENEAAGVGRFSLVTAGKTVTVEMLNRFKAIYERLAAETRLSFCASMGFLTKETVSLLKDMGVTRYHCNLETARSYFPQVCTTHSYDDKVDTIRLAQEAGLEVCSGGIIGMGETLTQRLELAFELRELGILSIPINILTPIANTPFAHLPPLTVGEVLSCIAMFRLINPQAVIRLAGGRNLLAEEQDKCFTAGANGAIVGNYLTTSGNGLDEDIRMFRRLGFTVDEALKRDE